jgi:hypothetical protein
MIDAASEVAQPYGPGLARPRSRLAPVATREQLRRAILRTVVYADLFEYAVSPGEIRRYLIGQAASAEAVAAALDRDGELLEHIGQTGDWFHLKGRESLADLRRQRGVASARLWPVAEHYGGLIARLPFVRLVGVTGALAMNNARAEDDVDLFILVRPGRLWFTRLLVLGVVKLAARRGQVICPNFLLSTDHLALSERNLFTAHEVVQMVAVGPNDWVAAFFEANRWAGQFLPNAFAEKFQAQWTGSPPSHRSGPVERLLESSVFDPVERWERIRKIRRLRARLEREGGSAAFSAHECRGHFAAHDARVLAAYRERLAELADVL